MFDLVKKYYDMGIYKKMHVEEFVRKGKITPEEYEMIVGEAYEN